MTRQKKSLLLSYIHQKHRSGKAGALFTVFIFAVLVLSLTNTDVAATAAATSNPVSQNYYADYNHGYPSTGMASQSTAFLAIWMLALVILVPVELALRKM